MKAINRSIIILLLGVFCISTAQAQLINQFKKEEAVFSYLQFPTEKARKANITIKVIEENMLGNAAKSVIKNEKIANALTAEGSILGNETQNISMDLIPGVFVTDGDLLAEVSFSPEFKSKKTMWLPEETYNYIQGGHKIQALVSYKVYSMPDKKLIYTQDKMWVNGMMKNSSSSTTSGSVTTTSGAAINTATKNMVIGWSKNKLDMLYGMGIRSKELTAYLIKKQEREDKKVAQEIQEKLVSCINTLRKDRGTDEYKATLDECIAHYNKMLKKHKKGAKKQKEALVTDNNVWCLNYNLAVAHMLKGNKKEAAQYIETASKQRVRKTKEFKNKKGEKVGEAKGMVPSGFYEISVLKNLVASYFKGIESMPKEFVAFLNSEEQMRNASVLAKEWGANILLSTIFDFETPATFKPEKLSPEAKSFTGTVSDGDKQVNFTFKPSFFLKFFGYSLTAIDNGNTKKAKVKYYNGSFRPKGTLYRNSYSLYLGDDKFVRLPSGAFYNTGKDIVSKTKLYAGASNAKGNKKPFSGVKFQYDYNGDILITAEIHREKTFWYGWVLTDSKEYLGVKRNVVRIKHKDFKEAVSMEQEITTIERERNAKFFEAFMEKSTKGLIPTDEIKNDKKSNKVSLSKKVADTDTHGNCINEKLNGSELTRTFVY